MSGYRDHAYAASLAQFGEPVFLPRSGGWLLHRPIPGTPHHDAMGCYPLFACDDWSALGADLDALGSDLVSVVLVADPMADVSGEQLEDVFTDRVVEFKQHAVTTLPCAHDAGLDAHHARNLRHARSRVEVRAELEPVLLLDAWCALYTELVSRHDIGGIQAFSREAFAAQLALGSMRALLATRDGDIVGMTLWLLGGETAYYHLGAYSAEGYRCKASYALFGAAREYFSSAGVRYLDLGASAGTVAAADGLARFKAGWSDHLRPAYLCGKILQPAVYAELTRAALASAVQPAPTGDFFPAYRAVEPASSAESSAESSR